MKCECDFDLRGDPGRYVRSNPSTLCTIHDMCCWCDESLAEVIDNGDKLCRACLAELTAGNEREDEPDSARTVEFR
jgi:hypothetical protein